MTPTTKATVVTIGVLFGFAAIPVLLIMLANWLLVITIAITYSAVLYLFLTEMYQVIRGELLRPMLEDQKAISGFDGDPMKIHFYKGFRKYFNGEVDEQGLQHWLERHRPQI